MLVITRKPGEYIVIELPDGERIFIAQTSVTGGSGRIGITCNRDFQVLRGELLDDHDAITSRCVDCGMVAIDPSGIAPKGWTTTRAGPLCSGCGRERYT